MVGAVVFVILVVIQFVVITKGAGRIAEVAAPRYADGAYFASLADVLSDELIPGAILQAVGSRPPAPGVDPLTHLLSQLADRNAVLVLDNFEHLLESAPLVGRILEGAPNCHVLVTSRSALRIAGEHEMAIDPLTVPAPNDELERAKQATAVAPAL